MLDIKPGLVSTTLESICGPQDEPEGLSLAKAPLTIATRSFEGGLEHMAIFKHPLSVEPLYLFLKRAADDRYSPGIGDVTVDMKSIDAEFWRGQDPYRGAKSGGRHASLDEMHRALGEAWTVTLAHRQVILDALEDNSDKLKYSGPQHIASEYLTRSRLVKQDIEDMGNPDNPITALFFRELDQLSNDELKAMIKSSRSTRKLTGQEKKMGKNQLKRRFLHRIRTGLGYEEFFMESEMWRKIIGEHITTNYQQAVFERDGEPLVYYKKREDDSGEPIKVPSTVTKTFNAREVIYESKPGYFGIDYEKSEFGMVYIQPNLIPLLHWTEVDGDRELQMGKVGKHPLLEAILEDQPDILVKGSTVDSLIGALSIPYFSPEIRATFPDTMHSPHGVRPQRIGPLQVITLGPIRKMQLAGADILPALEQAR